MENARLQRLLHISWTGHYHSRGFRWKNSLDSTDQRLPHMDGCENRNAVEEELLGANALYGAIDR